jgi:penicillin-binding protein 1C
MHVRPYHRQFRIFGIDEGDRQMKIREIISATIPGGFRKPAMYFCTAALFSVTVFLILDSLFPLPVERLQKPGSVFVYSRDGQLLRCFLSRDGFWRKRVRLSEISPLLTRSVISREDRWFYYHPGFNPFSLVSAAVSNVRAGKVVRGGSTITMQIARMMEPKERTIRSKLIEILRAVQLEFHYSKNELLEIYFNIAPYGGNMEGVGAAAYFYFDKKPIELTPSQAALLTSIPNSPTLLRPDRNREKSLAKRDRVLKTMLKREIITMPEYREAHDEPIPDDKIIPPFRAPHHTRDLAMRNAGNCIINSTLDLRIQSLCEGVMANNISDLESRGIYNAAVVVLDNATAEILALVGSADFLDSRRQGQVNGATSPRSPGSALKPFVYSMALDKGIISPNSLLRDLPVDYSGYSPENYDRRYRGAVSASDALKLSLNVPAVELCADVGQKDFYDLLKTAGISSLHREYYDYGLPIILGSCEVSLVELTNLYSTLARGGLYRPLDWTAGDNRGDTLRLFSSGTSYIISEILSELKRPDFPSCWEFSPDIPRVAWKTGTSYGRKDAWSVGYNPRYSVGVWVGNFSGESSPYLVGAEAAAPLLFQDIHWFDPPLEVSRRMVCETSGRLPISLCDATIEELYMPGVSPAIRCDIHRELTIDRNSGFRLCKFCEHGKSTVSEKYECFPPRIMTWMLRSGMAAPLPEHNPDCSGTSHGDRPVIISPVEDTDYVLRDYLPASHQSILLDASVASGAKWIYWFVNGALYGKVNPGQEIFLVPEKGKHKITCCDDRGRSTSVELNVL